MSVDGIKWSSQVSPQVQAVNGLTYANGLFVSVGDAAELYTSPDGMMAVGYTVSGDMFVAAKPHLWAAKKDLGAFDLAPDGKRFAVLQPDEAGQNASPHVVVLLNFFDELRRRATARGK